MSGNYPAGVHDSDFNDDPDGLDEEEEEDDPEHWVCAYPGECLMPSVHCRDECHTVSDMVAYYKEMEGVG